MLKTCERRHDVHPHIVMACGCYRCRTHCFAVESCPDGWRLRQAYFGARVRQAAQWPGDEDYEQVSLAEFDRRRDGYFAHFEPARPPDAGAAREG